MSTVNALAEMVVVTFPATSVSTITYVTAPSPVRFPTDPVHEVSLPVRVTVGSSAPLNVTTGAADRLSLEVTFMVTDAPELKGPVPDCASRKVTGPSNSGAVVSMTIVWSRYNPDAPNAGSASVATFPAVSAIVPVSALVDW